jgi:hypothetical protein
MVHRIEELSARPAQFEGNKPNAARLAKAGSGLFTFPWSFVSHATQGQWRRLVAPS